MVLRLSHGLVIVKNDVCARPQVVKQPVLIRPEQDDERCGCTAEKNEENRSERNVRHGSVGLWERRRGQGQVDRLY